MFTDQNGNILIDVKVSMPWAPEPVVKQITIAADTARCMRPLSRDRDLPAIFHLANPTLRQESASQEVARLNLANCIASDLSATLAHIILSACSSRDPQHGYSPEEWAEIQIP